MSGKRRSAAVSTGWGINAAICDLQRGVPSLCSIMQDCRTRGGNIHAIHTF